MGRCVKSELKDPLRRPAQALGADTLIPKTEIAQDMLDHLAVIDTFTELTLTPSEANARNPYSTSVVVCL